MKTFNKPVKFTPAAKCARLFLNIISMNRFRIALIIFSVYLSGCATVDKGYIDKNFIPEPKAGKAIFFGSVTQSRNVLGGTNARFFINAVGKQSGSYVVRPKSLHNLLIGYGDFVSEFSDVDGNIFAFEVPAGEYQLHYWNVDTGNTLIYPKAAPQPLMFEVNEGEVVYIGNVHMNYATGKNIIGLNITVDAIPEVKDNHRRDIERFLYKYKNFDESKIVSKVLPSGLWGSRIINKSSG